MPNDLCEACGERNAHDTDFCLACGMYLGWGERLRLQRSKVGAATASGAPAVSEERDGLSTGDHQPSIARESAPQTARHDPRPVSPAASRTDARENGTTATPSAQRRVRPQVAQEAPEPAMDAASQEPAGSACPRCGRPNAAERRFCAKCGLTLAADPRLAQAAIQMRAHQRLPWWRRLFPRRKSITARAAEKSYRRTLPLRYRVTRIVTFLLVVCLLGGGFAVAGRNPVSWAKYRWADMRDTQEVITGVTASADPAGCVLGQPEYAPEHAVDGIDELAWARNWSPDPVPRGECDVTIGGDLLLSWAEPREVVGLLILAGLAEGNASTGQQWRPQELELRFSDGMSQRVTLIETAEEQQVEIEPVSTSDLRIEIIRAYPPPDGEVEGRVAISEVKVVARPAG